MNDSILAAAIDYAKAGLRVLPVYGVDSSGACACGNPHCQAAGKHPSISAWQQHATSDLQQVRTWFSSSAPQNIGVATGRGLLVLDLDGEAGAEWIRVRNVPLTWVTRTGSGGLHYWFKLPPGATYRNTARKLAPGVDTRADGGQVIAPPSRNARGDYQWLVSPADTELAPAPEWLLALLAENSAEEPRHADDLPEKILPGQRNSMLASLAGSMRRRGASSASILAALEVENREKCQPPLESAEVEAIAASVSRYAPETPLVVTYGAATTVAEVAPTPPDGWLTDAADLLAMDIQDPVPLLGGAGTGTLLAPNDLAVWHGAPRSWKSFTALLSAVCVATGSPLADHWPASRARVVYVQEEGSRVAWQRRLRWCLSACHAEAEDLRGWLHTSVSARFRLDDLAWLASLREELARIRPAVLFMDPLGQISSHDENDATETGALVRLVRDLQIEFGVSVVLIHHDRKHQPGSGGRRAEGLRGSSALWAACGTVSFDRTENGCSVEAELKDAEPVPRFELEYEICGDRMAVTYASAPPDSRTAAEERVLAAIAAGSMPLTHSEIIAATGLTDTRAREARDRLIQRGKVEQAGQRGRALTYRVPPG